MQASLEVCKLRLNVHLGVSAEERALEQPVDVSFSLRFESPPAACKTDKIEDSICYDQLSRVLGEVVMRREFSLVEHLASELVGALKTVLPTQTQLNLSVHKLRPPVRDLHGGVVFSLSEF